MATPKLGFINLAFGGKSALKEANSAFPQDFVVPNRPEYGSNVEPLKTAGHFMGAMYGNKRSLDLLKGSENIAGRLATGGIVGMVAIPKYSRMFGVEVRIDSPLVNPDGVIVTGATVKLKLASTATVIATVPIDAIGTFYYDLDGIVPNTWVGDWTDTIEIEFAGVPVSTAVDDEFACIPLPCLEDMGLCISVAVNYINNAIENRCQEVCPQAYTLV